MVVLVYKWLCFVTQSCRTTLFGPSGPVNKGYRASSDRQDVVEFMHFGP